MHSGLKAAAMGSQSSQCSDMFPMYEINLLVHRGYGSGVEARTLHREPDVNFEATVNQI